MIFYSIKFDQSKAVPRLTGKATKQSPAITLTRIIFFPGE